MPLPAALAARLAKRGLLNSNNNKADPSKKEPKKKVHEEVIAEDYDTSKEEISQIDIAQKFMGYSGCPNKYNIYHECTRKCKELWGKGHIQPSERYLKRQMKLVQKYPLPETWKAIYDPGTGRHYYWDWSSDLVAWLPPSHPRCQISQPASQLREELHLKEAEQDDNMSSDESGSDQEPAEVDDQEAKKKRDDVPQKEARDKDSSNRDKESVRERYKGGDSRRYQKPDKNKDSNKKDRTLDPMDPAAYSDIPRGKWSDGLAKQNEAKTGADTTAAGPLYQMRPYPSPGAVLRSNKTSKPEPESGAGKSKAVSFPEEPE
ncbi:polyglutamine-binding protein 1 [Nasonia vitripennis]|uniref:WW domain-containing protein n=1 Tax=Nasonia vitripennis TaxID=7425 RepID=A0A7M7H826_NASVI|nr:polyglutamine-binding protein 1 [Nasonia vitripennis]